jgi:hypothetical protein
MSLCHQCTVEPAWAFCARCFEPLCDAHITEGCCGSSPAFIMDAETRDAALKQRDEFGSDRSCDDDLDDFDDEDGAALAYRSEAERDDNERDYDDQPRGFFVDYDLPGWTLPIQSKEEL